MTLEERVDGFLFNADNIGMEESDAEARKLLGALLDSAEASGDALRLAAVRDLTHLFVTTKARSVA